MSKFFLPVIEFDITNLCNIKCAHCSHFSNFATTVEEYDIIQFESDIKRLSELFIIKKLKLLGGEPFLYSKDLIILIDIILNYFPRSSILIYTNGTCTEKINSLQNKIFSNLTKYKKVEIYISEYPGVNLKSPNIEYKKHLDKSKFGLIDLNFKGDSNPEIARSICVNANCPSVYNGKLYICPTMKNIKEVLNYFNIKLDINEDNFGCDIYTNSAEKLINYLYSFDDGLSLCRFCGYHSKYVPWARTTKDISEVTLTTMDLTEFKRQKEYE